MFAVLLLGAVLSGLTIQGRWKLDPGLARLVLTCNPP